MNPEIIQKTKLRTIVWYSYLLLISAIGLMKPFISISNQKFLIADFIFLGTAFFWLISIILRQNIFRWHKYYLLLAFYLAAMAISATFSNRPAQTFVKLLGEIYLLGLAVITYNLVRSLKDFKQVFISFLTGTAVIVLIGLAALIIFYVQPGNDFLKHTLYHYGAVPVGNYPRISSILVSASMLCNFLNVGLIILCAARILNWISDSIFYIFFAAIFICSVFTISAGFGGIILSLGGLFWIVFHQRRKLASQIFLFGGIAFSISFLILSVVALKPHPTATYKIIVPFLQTEVYPSSRLLVWSASLKTFSDNFFFGNGLSQNACAVIFQNTDGSFSLLTDAHNIFLSVAAQSGIFGLIAICLIIYFISKPLFVKDSGSSEKTVLRSTLCLAFTSAFFYQGLTGSFEEARHLWMLIGLIFAVDNLE